MNLPPARLWRGRVVRAACDVGCDNGCSPAGGDDGPAHPVRPGLVRVAYTVAILVVTTAVAGPMAAGQGGLVFKAYTWFITQL